MFLNDFFCKSLLVHLMANFKQKGEFVWIDKWNMLTVNIAHRPKDDFFFKGTPLMKLEIFLNIQITNFFIKKAVPSKILHQTLSNL